MSETSFKIKIPAEAQAMCLVDQSMVSWFSAVSESAISKSDLNICDTDQSEFQASGDPFWDNQDYRWFRPYNVVRGADGTGVLVIPVKGSLVAGLTGQFGSYATGYEYIIAAIKRGITDTTVKSIVLDVNSPGGMVRGCSECGDAIAAATKIKPVLAYAADTAASAAYWLASQATEIHVSNTGEVGSIGVITGHWDESQLLANMGIKYTPMFAGERKNDLSPYLPLTDDAKAAMQERLNAIYAEFISAVARGRGMNGNDIRNTQAAMFASRKSVRVGLADRVSTRDEVMSAAFGSKLEAQIDETETDNQEQDMTDKTEDTNTATDASEAVRSAMARAQEILGCDEAKGREAQARMFAFDASFASTPVDKVKQLLAAATAATPAADTSKNAFEAAMATTENPNVGAGAGGETIDPVLAASLGMSRK